MVEAGVVALVLAFQGVAALPLVVAQFIVNGASAVKYYSVKAAAVSFVPFSGNKKLKGCRMTRHATTQ